jgi:hypothetical protein
LNSSNSRYFTNIAEYFDSADGKLGVLAGGMLKEIYQGEKWKIKKLEAGIYQILPQVL